jgi:NADPH:quinone reductase-like Zn-dependent oxidoreductase
VKAVAYPRHGGPEVLQLVDAPDPIVGPGDVIVEVRAAAVNRFDLILRAGEANVPGFSLPAIPGMDVSGVVVARADDVTEIDLGTRVVMRPHSHCGRCVACGDGDEDRCTSSRFLGATAPGGYAELVVSPATHVIPLPDHLTFGQAAALPTSLSTAWRGLVGTAGLQRGETVLIHGAGSGVSTTAIQVARHLGATVIATSRSDETLRRAAAIGADVVINSSTTDVAAAARAATEGKGVDVVFDHVGPALFAASLHSLAAGGRLVVCGTTTGSEVCFALPDVYYRAISVLGIRPQRLDEFRHMFDVYFAAGIVPVVADELPLASAAEAHRRLEAGDVFGKLILVP